MSTHDIRYGQALDQLQQRYRAVKLVRPTSEVAQEMGVSVLTLARFEREGYVGAGTLHTITAWVRAQERGETPRPTITEEPRQAWRMGQ